MSPNDYLVFATPAYAYLQAAICHTGGHEPGAIARDEFPDGEHYKRVTSRVTGRDVVLVGGTITDRDTLEVYDLATTFVMEGARSLSLVVPFFGYSTMERAVRPGEVVTAKIRARLLSTIPTAAMGNHIALLDLHSEGIPHYFEGSLRPTHLYGKHLVKAACRELEPDGRYTLACTDAGRAKWVESLANDLHVPPAFVFKRRLSGDETEVSAVSAQVEGRAVIIYDDMIRTGGSLMAAARCYHEAGASRISVVTTHGLFPGDALERLRASGLFERIVCTDSHPRAVALQNDFLQVKSVAGLICDHLAEGRVPISRP